MRIIVVDDDAYIIKLITHYLKANKEVELLGAASNVQDAVALISKKQPDVLFLDVELGDRLSFEILKQLPHIQSHIVFITAHSDYAIQAIRYAAFDYILKPVQPKVLDDVVKRLLQKDSKDDLEERLRVLEANMQSVPKRLVLKSAEKYKVVQQEEVVYLKADNTYTMVYSKDDEAVLVSQSIKYFEEILPTNMFMRTHRSYIINLSHVSEYIKADGGYIVMSNGDRIILSATKKNSFLDRLERI